MVNTDAIGYSVAGYHDLVGTDTPGAMPGVAPALPSAERDRASAARRANHVQF